MNKKKPPILLPKGAAPCPCSCFVFQDEQTGTYPDSNAVCLASHVHGIVNGASIHPFRPAQCLSIMMLPYLGVPLPMFSPLSMLPIILIKHFIRRPLHIINLRRPVQHPLMQRLPIHTDILLRQHHGRLEPVVRQPLQGIDIRVAVAHDCQPQALETVVEVLPGVFMHM